MWSSMEIINSSGWGELSLGNNKTGKNFMYAEAGLWLSFLVTNQLVHPIIMPIEITKR